jgi:hypothetical protein
VLQSPQQQRQRWDLDPFPALPLEERRSLGRLQRGLTNSPNRRSMAAIFFRSAGELRPWISVSPCVQFFRKLSGATVLSHDEIGVVPEDDFNRTFGALVSDRGHELA